MSNYRIIYSDHLAHHGILGQKWGKRNGPPYPLDSEDHSTREKKVGWRKSLKENKKANKKFKLTEKQKKYIKIGIAVAAIAVAAGVTAYAVKSGKADILISSGQKMYAHMVSKTNGDLFNRISSGIKFSPEKLMDERLFSSFSDAQKGAITKYTGAGYKEMNAILRQKLNIDSFSSSYYKHQFTQNSVAIDELTKAISSSKLKEEVTTFRMVTTSGAKAMFPDLYSSDSTDLVGRIFREDGFFSSSPKPKASFGDVKLTTICPKGTQALYIGKHSYYPHEQELLLQRGTDFKVLEVIRDSLGDPIEIILEVADQLA